MLVAILCPDSAFPVKVLVDFDLKVSIVALSRAVTKKALVDFLNFLFFVRSAHKSFVYLDWFC
jgi:hypothetical protein